jgi:ABC-type polysaccharide/polyol phosphate transport system ATPase subunit
VFVSHDLHAVSRFCERALLLHGGTIQAIGEPQNVIDAYRARYTNPIEVNL